MEPDAKKNQCMDENSDVLTIQRWSLHNVSIIRTDLNWFVILVFVLREPTWTGLGKTRVVKVP